MSERATLVSRVKRARDELELLGMREKGNSRSVSRVAQRKEENSYNERDAKAALIQEIAELKSDKSVFLVQTREIELTVKDELAAKLAEIEETMVRIADFQKTTLELMEQQKANAARVGRIKVLKAELADLRAKV
jgi:hypothetical protein